MQAELEYEDSKPAKSTYILRVPPPIPPPPNQGGTNSAAGEGVGETQCGRLEGKPWTLSTLCSKLKHIRVLHLFCITNWTPPPGLIRWSYLRRIIWLNTKECLTYAYMHTVKIINALQVNPTLCLEYTCILRWWVGECQNDGPKTPENNSIV